MNRIVLTTALIASLAAPAFAGSLNTAVTQFNGSIESANEMIRLAPAQTERVSVSTRNGALGVIVANYNASQDSDNNRINIGSATSFPSTPAYAQDIFADLNAEDN